MKHDAQKNLNDQMKAILELDLEQIKSKLMDTDDGPGWPREQADACEIEYKRFLALAVNFPEEALVPSVEVDLFWHTHILDTRKYAEDCQNAFGFFLHHTPHYGPRETADAERMSAAFARTSELCAKLFGELAAGQATWCTRAGHETEKPSAWCTRAEDKSTKQAAWCTRAEDKSTQQAAWCTRAEDKTTKQAAWCTRAEDKSTQQAAWCTLAEDKTTKQAAWCTRAADTEQQFALAR